ncbi:PREDICTED: C-C motif chemokine 5-like [Acanthisitta chloris]|uniref:C-C motif chemokine 5-like n=1 Tax=Acanthisitta chloris TaxID=57068 RepID=UPI0004F0E432|nr:PREDICTED: C-C motif chemokine 5-like [Acanthisitta chloris]
MKVLAAALVALLLVATCSPSEAHLDGVPTSCCSTYQQRPVPRSRIDFVYPTSSSCTNPGVILVTKRKKVVCVDPQASWVQEILKNFQTLKN